MTIVIIIVVVVVLLNHIGCDRAGESDASRGDRSLAL